MRSNDAHAASPRAAAALGEVAHTSKAALRPRTVAGVKMSASLDWETVGPLGSVVMPGSASFFLTANHSVIACVVSPRSFDSAASFCKIQMWVQERAAQSELAEPCPCFVSKSLLHVGDVASGHFPRMRPSGRASCGRLACGTSLRSSQPAAKHLWRGVRSSDA